ncbi:ankyrin repeat domain-containing protein SOWAHC-like [Centropristis striata]|uniref:ankyrin repeat domain-containing protein SOWAHC-like n=1 Tax=Centropristis striata TaxID=184440 RepID=UPI0027E0ECC0|nr:ankyrin repeat domain-containing protein SOWAHC-like [Centropristis striata]
MAAECSQEAVLCFLKERGGKVKNTDLIEHFKAVFPEEPEEKAAVRKSFKNFVDNVAFVKTESGVKYVCLKKKFRGLENRYHSHGDDVAGEPALQPHVQQQQPPPGSGYGNDSQVRVPHFSSSATIYQDKADDGSPESRCPEFVCIVEEVDSCSGEMGNRTSFWGEKRESKKSEKAPDIPEIAVIEASPLPAEGSMFTLPGPAQTGPTGQEGLSPRDTQVETLSPEALKDAEQVTGCRYESDDGEDEGHLDVHSLSGSEDTSSPKGSRKHFIEVMMNSSPQVRRSMVYRGSVYLSSRSDSDSLSLVSIDDRTSVALDPLEHEWMMCASDGEWGSLCNLLATEPGLLLKKDFVTGFTCLHWAAKQDKPELIALIINFAKQHNVPISVDVRSNTGYTPLHIAAMHNHMDVVKLLVGAYNADVEIRDYSGRKACQYLTDNVSVDIRDIIGAYERSDPEDAHGKDGGRWRFSKVLQSKPLRLLNPSDCDYVDGEARPREKPLRRKSSFSRMKPKLQKLRRRTSQIVHSVSFHDTEEGEGSRRESFKTRPKTHFFG